MYPRTHKRSAGATLILVTIALVALPAGAATRRAVIVGIDEYETGGETPVARGNPPDPRAWKNLQGAVNDAVRVRDLLIARYGFKRSDVVFRSNQDATRERILAAIDSHLVGKSQRGDVAFFFFAGHGSRVRNSLSLEPDRLDESIVPADGASGAADIRDKELRERFNRILASGAVLAAVFDSCHSGSIARAAAGSSTLRTRMLPIDPRDVKDASRAPSPWENGGLILSASQHDELAREAYDDFRQVGGLFAIAFARALRSASVDEPANELFRRVKAQMANSGMPQQPVLEATAARQTQPLFGGDGARLSGRVVAAVQSANGGSIMLQEGLATGMTPGTELIPVDAASPRLRVTSVSGLMTSTVRVVVGNSSGIRPGDLYVVDRWAPPDVPNLRVWIPETQAGHGALVTLAREWRNAVEAAGHAWVADPAAEAPTHVLMPLDGEWWLWPPEGARIALGREPKTADLTARLGAPRARLFAMLPAPGALRAAINIGPDSPNNAIEAGGADVADYFLMGRTSGAGLAYAWVRPWQTGSIRTTLPYRSDWVDGAGPEAAGAELARLAARLGRVNAWLKLDGAPGRVSFPYRLALEKEGSGELVSDGAGVEGDAFTPVLVRTKPRVTASDARFVYVFSINSFGESVLLYPMGSAVENRYPPEEDAAAGKPRYALRDSTFDVGPPFGTDTIVLVTTSEQLPDPLVFQAPGARSRSAAADLDLPSLFENVGATSRGTSRRALPVKWSVERTTLHTTPRR